MRNTELHPQERTARKLLTQRPLFVGTSGTVAVYWDGVAREFAAIDQDGDHELVALADTPFETPRQYCDHIQVERGWDTGPNIGGSLVDDLRCLLA